MGLSQNANSAAGLFSLPRAGTRRAGYARFSEAGTGNIVPIRDGIFLPLPRFRAVVYLRARLTVAKERWGRVSRPHRPKTKLGISYGKHELLRFPSFAEGGQFN